MDQQPEDASSPPGSPEIAPEPSSDVQNHVSPLVEDAIDEDAAKEDAAGADDRSAHPTEDGIVERDDDDDAYVAPHTVPSHGVAGHQDETNPDPEVGDENEHNAISTAPRIPPALIHKDAFHLAKHLHEQPGALMSMFNWAHYIKSKIGSAVQNVIAHFTDIKDAIKSAVDRLRNVLGHNFENVPLIIKQSAEEAGAWVKKNPKMTADCGLCCRGHRSCCICCSCIGWGWVWGCRSYCWYVVFKLLVAEW